MQQKYRVPVAYPIAASGGTYNVNTKVSLPVSMKKHIFQSSASITLTPVLFSGADGTAQAIAAGETWETTAPLSGFKSSAAATVYWCGDIN